MPGRYEIRADYDRTTLVVYQAYPPAIAMPALKEGRFVPPFSFNRMTWIKPSFLWLMERSNWGRKPGQECVLAIRITRAGWEEALSLGVLTHPEPGVYRDHQDWKTQFDQALVHIQWDPERSLQGASLDYYAIQVGLSRHVIERYVHEWIVEIQDYTPRAGKMAALLRVGNRNQARKLLPREQVYPVPPAIARRLSGPQDQRGQT